MKLATSTNRVVSVKFLHESKIAMVLLGCGVLLLAALAGGFYLQYLNDAAQGSRHLSTRRLLALEETLSSLQELRIQQGSLLITGKAQYQSGFESARGELARSVEALQTLYAGSDAHDQRVIRELVRLCDSKVSELLAAAELQRSSGFDVARAMFMSRNADDYGMGIHLLIDHLKQREAEANRQTDALIGRQHTQLMSAAVGVFLLAVLCGALAHTSLQREVAQRQALALRLEHEATHDALTGLPNRRSFMQELERSLARADRAGSAMGILFIDLDGFKRINDDFGHHCGDELLRTLGSRLTCALRKSDVLARLGGDEFAVIAQPADAQALVQLAERLIAVVSMPLLPGQADRVVSASVGVALYPTDAADGTALLSEADTAMYQAKRAGKGRVVRAGR